MSSNVGISFLYNAIETKDENTLQLTTAVGLVVASGMTSFRRRKQSKLAEAGDDVQRRGAAFGLLKDATVFEKD